MASFAFARVGSCLLSVLLVTLVACAPGGEDGGGSSNADLSRNPSEATRDASVADNDASVTSSPTGDFCPGNTSYDFEFKGEGLSAWEGRAIVVVAQEYNGGPTTVGRKIALRISGKIQSGKVDLACAKSIDRTIGDGRVAAYIDVNGDGRCTPGQDVGLDIQDYGFVGNVHMQGFDPSVTPGPVAHPDEGYFELLDVTPREVPLYQPELNANLCLLFN
jgi:hypothetical protein